MTEKKKDDLNEQQSFLDSHEELLKNINKPEPEEEPASFLDQLPLPNKPAQATEEAPSAPEKVPSPEVKAEDEKKPAPQTSAVKKETPAPTKPQPRKPAPQPKPKPSAQAKKPKSSGAKKKKKKKPQHPHHHTERDNEAAQRHEELLKQQKLEQQEVKEVLVFVQKYAKPAATAILVVCILILANGIFKNMRLKKQARADSALLHAQGPSDLQAIIDDYASTPAAPLAMMTLAREKFNEGSYDEARNLYLQFTQKHARHELATQAQLNLIACKEAAGQKEEAQKAYGEFAASHEGSYLAPTALLGRARCLEALGRPDEARVVYEDMIAEFPEDSAWSRTAEMNLEILKARQG